MSSILCSPNVTLPLSFVSRLSLFYSRQVLSISIKSLCWAFQQNNNRFCSPCASVLMLMLMLFVLSGSLSVFPSVSRVSLSVSLFLGFPLFDSYWSSMRTYPMFNTPTHTTYDAKVRDGLVSHPRIVNPNSPPLPLRIKFAFTFLGRFSSLSVVFNFLSLSLVIYVLPNRDPLSWKWKRYGTCVFLLLLFVVRYFPSDALLLLVLYMLWCKGLGSASLV